MEKATWEEIKALASDFKRTQAITSNQKLTERNCIDIINYLCGSKQLSLYFTTDGKTFLTPQELEKEIYEELEIAHGRIELTKLSTILDLESYTIENTIYKMVTNDNDIQIVNGNLVNASYIRSVALKINEITKNKGKATILELTQQFSLPKQFIEKIITNNMDNNNSIIEAHKDGEMLYTNNFIRRHTAMIRGYLTRSSKPVAISVLNQKFSIFEKLIIRIISELIDKKRIFGKFDQNKTVFIPDIQLRNQKLYFQRFFEQNNYLDFQTMKEIGIQNPGKYVEIEFPTLTILSSCALGEGIVSQLEVSIQECNRNGNFFNCYQILPAIVNGEDLHDLIMSLCEKYEKLVFIAEEFIVSKDFIGKCVASYDEIIKIKAQEFVKKNKKSIVHILHDSTIQDSLEEETSIKKEKISKFKSGGGLTGREIKVKSVKNKYISDKKSANQKSVNKKPSNDTNQSHFEYLNKEEGLDILSKQFTGEDVTDELLTEIFQLIEKQLHFNYKNQCKLEFLQTTDTAKSKTEHQNLELKLSTMIGKIRLFEQGLLEISTESLRNDLIRYNLKALCCDVVNCLFEHIAIEHDFSWDSAAGITNELKTKLINHVPHNLSVVMKTLNKSLKDDEKKVSFDNFYSAFEAICEFLGIRPKKLDKKADKNLILEISAQYHSIIIEKVDKNQYIEPGELLLITTVLIFQKIIGLPLHSTGKFVPAILEFLKSKTLSINTGIDWDSLKEYQNYVVGTFKLHNATEEDKEAFKESHRDLHKKIIEIALNWKSIKSC